MDQRATRLTPARTTAWPSSDGHVPGWLLTAAAWTAPVPVALVVVLVLTQDVAPFRLVLPIVAVVVIMFMRPRASTAIALAAVAIPGTAILRRVTGGPHAFVPDDPLAVLVIITLLPALLVGFSTRRTSPRSTGLNLVLAYIVWVVFSSLLAVGGSGTAAARVTGLAITVVPVTVGYLVASGRIPRADRIVTKSLYILPLLTAGYAIAQFVQPPDWDMAWLRSVSRTLTSVGQPEAGAFRVWGTMEAPLPLAIYLGLGLLALLVLFVARRGEPGAVTRMTGGIAAAAVLLAALLLTSVRSVLFALPVLIALVVVLNLLPGARRYGALLLLLVVGGTVVGVGLFGFAPEGTDADRYAISGIGQDQSFQDRADLLPTFVLAAQEPFGTGAGTSGLAQRLTADGKPIGVDNGYLTLVLEGGIVRLLLFLALFGWAVVTSAATARRRPRDPQALLPVLVILYFGLLHVSADVVSGGLSTIFWIYLGAVVRDRQPPAPVRREPPPVRPARVRMDPPASAPAGAAQHVDGDALTRELPMVR